MIMKKYYKKPIVDQISVTTACCQSASGIVDQTPANNGTIAEAPGRYRNTLIVK